MRFTNSSELYKNSSELTASGIDFFAFLMENNWMKLTAMFFCSIQVFILPIFLFGIIWFERFGLDQKRTMINMMVSANCWAVIEFW
jgi:hypothetical protein